MPCLNLMMLMQDNVLNSTQRLKAIYIISDLYSPNTYSIESRSTSNKSIKEEECDNPFLSFFLDSLKYSSDPAEQHFLASRLTYPDKVRS